MLHTYQIILIDVRTNIKRLHTHHNTERVVYLTNEQVANDVAKSLENTYTTSKVELVYQCVDCGTHMYPDETYVIGEKSICEYCYYSG